MLKKAKVKDEAIKLKVTDAVKNYNAKVKEISFLNSDKFKGIDVILKFITENRGRNASNNENNNGDNVRKKIRELISPIRREVRDNEVVLNQTLENLLSNKQNKKWLKYQKNQKDELRPKRTERGNNRQQPQNQNRQRRF